MSKINLIKIQQPNDNLVKTIEWVKEQTGIKTNSGAVEFIIGRYRPCFQESADLHEQNMELENKIRLMENLIIEMSEAQRRAESSKRELMQLMFGNEEE